MISEALISHSDFDQVLNGRAKIKGFVNTDLIIKFDTPYFWDKTEEYLHRHFYVLSIESDTDFTPKFKGETLEIIPINSNHDESILVKRILIQQKIIKKLKSECSPRQLDTISKWYEQEDERLKKETESFENLK